MNTNDKQVVVTYDSLLHIPNKKLYDLLVQGVRDQFLNPDHRIILRLSKDEYPDLDTDNLTDNLELLSKVYHNIEYTSRKLSRVDVDVDSIAYINDDPYDQAMYQNMLESMLGPSQLKSFIFVERLVINQINKIVYATLKLPKEIPKAKVDENIQKKMREGAVQSLRKKKVKYFDISQNPKAQIISKLYSIDIKQIKFEQVRYYFIRQGFQFQAYKSIPDSQKITEFDYIGALQDMGAYHKSKSYYSELLADKTLVQKLSDAKEKGIRIDQLDIPESVKDFVCTTYAKYRKDIFILTVWGAEYVSDLVEKLESDGKVYYVKNLEVDYQTLEAIMFWIYNEFSFEKRQEFITKKLEYIDAKKEGLNKLAVIVFDNINNLPISGQGSKYKTEIRNMLVEKLKSKPKHNPEIRGNDLLHINDYHFQTVEYCQTYFNRNTLKMLGSQDRSLFLKRSNNRSNLVTQTFRSYIYQSMSYKEIDRLITIGSMSLYAYGVRRNNDIDSIMIDVREKDPKLTSDIEKFFMNKNTKFGFADIGIMDSKNWNTNWTAKNDEWLSAIKGGPVSITDLATNPDHHFYFQGLKVSLIEYEIVRKILRGEAHDALDLVMIQSLFGDKIDTKQYYSIMTDDQIAKLKPYDNPIEYHLDDPAMVGTHGKGWATLGKAEDTKTVADLLERSVAKRYDRDQIDKVSDLAVIKHLVKN